VDFIEFHPYPVIPQPWTAIITGSGVVPSYWGGRWTWYRNAPSAPSYTWLRSPSCIHHGRPSWRTAAARPTTSTSTTTTPRPRHRRRRWRGRGGSDPDGLPGAAMARSSAEEGAQGGVDLVGVRPEQPVRGAVDLDVLRLGQQLAEAAGRRVDGQDVVRGAVQDEGRQAAGTDRLDVAAEVLDPGGDDGVGRHGSAGDGDVPAAGHRVLADPAAEVLVEVVEVGEELREPGVPVLPRGGVDPVEDLLRHPLGIVVAGHEVGLERGEEREPGDALDRKS